SHERHRGICPLQNSGDRLDRQIKTRTVSIPTIEDLPLIENDLITLAVFLDVVKELLVFSPLQEWEDFGGFMERKLRLVALVAVRHFPEKLVLYFLGLRQNLVRICCLLSIPVPFIRVLGRFLRQILDVDLSLRLVVI